MTSSTLSAGQRDELVGLSNEAAAITAKAIGENRPLTAEETTQLEGIVAKAAPIKDQVRLLKDLEDIQAMKGWMTGAAGSPVSVTMDGTKTLVTAQTMGQSFVNSKQFQAFTKSSIMSDNGQPHLASGTRVLIDPVSTPSMVSEIHRTTKALVTLNPVGAATSNGLTPLVPPDRQGLMFDYSIMQDRVLLGLIRRIPTGSNLIEWVVKLNRGTNAAAIVAEAETVATAANKPESTFYDYEIRTKAVDTIAHWMPVTRQALWDTPQLEGMINEFLADGIAERLEALLQTTLLGTAGILNVPGGGAGVTDLDDILNGIALVRKTAKQNPDVVLMSPDDWYSAGFALSKDSTGRYLLVDPTRSADDGVSLWGRRLIISDQFAANTAIVANLSNVIMWDRMATVISATDSHSDWFTKNLIAVLAEARASFTVGYPQAICTVGGI